MDPSFFIEKWRQSGASERANKDSFLVELCELLEVPHPEPATGDPERDRYVFERDAVLVHGGERHTIGKIDLYRHGCFILEAKQGSERESKKLGTARRGTAAWNVSMQEAFGQALQYASTIEPPPPFLIVTDIGYCFDLYASFDGSRRYRKFPDALSSRINIEGLRDAPNRETLRTIFTDPHSLDPSKRAARVTREIAGYLANLAKSLGDAGHPPELVAKFLMRCLFTMFAEDVELLPRGIFADAFERWVEKPESFPAEVEELWRRMNDGGTLWGGGKIWRFNGGLFENPIALPLTKHELGVLRMAAASNWSDVEPAIFGTLLERALDPKERHRLGAHYTPRAYVERLVRPTIEEPLREEWDAVRAQVVAMIAGVDPEKNKKVVAEARKIVHDFYDRLTKIRVLDPACGSGNFLFVALDLFKRIENEVIELLDSLGNDRAIVTFGRMVTPEQFLGIEIKPWAKEITELVLWIGWLQWQIRTKGWKSQPQEPILRDYHNIECRDAVLASDRVEPLLDDDGKPVTRWDGETMKISPVTGEEIPDDSARVPVMRYVNPKKAKWPTADFIVGNPPYIGTRRIRTALGDSYVDVLRATYPDVPETADLVMYWWDKAASLLQSGSAKRFGFITTNSITQDYSRPVLDRHLENKVRIVFAIPDHPWVETATGANVRVAMSVGTLEGRARPLLCQVVDEAALSEEVAVQLQCVSPPSINSALTAGTNARDLTPLKANSSLCFQGVVPAGDGFKIDPAELRSVPNDEQRSGLRSYVIGRDLVQRPEERYIIDFFGLSAHEARNEAPVLYQRLLDRVCPARSENKRAAYRDKWWLFAEPRPAMRRALERLQRYIGTPYTAKHRPFVFLDAKMIPDAMVYAIASDDPLVFGCLSSRAHVVFSRAAGGSLEDRPRYNSNQTFLPFAFPSCGENDARRIRDLGEQLDAHRKRQQALHPDLTITGMYNVMEKLRSGEALTAKEKKIHEDGLVSVLKQIHDDLDAAVFDAYGWPLDLTDEQILERLVALNADRAEEEKRGIIRWLRPEFQNPAGITKPVETQESIELPVDRMPAPKTGALPASWPKELPRQIAALRDLVANTRTRESWTAGEAAKAFLGAKRKDVEPVLDSLAAVGLLVAFDTPRGRRWQPAVN